MKRLRILLIGLGVVLALVAAVPFVSLSGGGRCVAVRGADGTWTWTMGGRARRMPRAAYTESQAQSSNAWQNLPEPLAVRRVWVHARTEDGAAVVLARAVQEALLADDLLQEVAYLPPGDEGEGLAGPPDMHLVVELVESTEHIWPGKQELSLALRCYADRRAPKSGAGGVVQPGAALMEASIDYEETAYGLVPRDARYTGAAAALLEVMILEDRLARWRGERPRSPRAD